MSHIELMFIFIVTLHNYSWSVFIITCRLRSFFFFLIVTFSFSAGLFLVLATGLWYSTSKGKTLADIPVPEFALRYCLPLLLEKTPYIYGESQTFFVFNRERIRKNIYCSWVYTITCNSFSIDVKDKRYGTIF